MSARRRWSSHENRSRVRSGAVGGRPLTSRPRSVATRSTTSSRAPAGSMVQDVDRIGIMTARSTDPTCESSRRILSYTSSESGQRSAGLVSTRSAPSAPQPASDPPLW
ncbi:hypothetical protein ACFPRL_30355 [Pseudoclavibacter helvolus]